MRDKYVAFDDDTGAPMFVPGTAAGGLSSAAALTVTFARPDNVLDYAAGAVIGTATDATAALTLAGLAVPGQAALITGTGLFLGMTAIPSGMTSFSLALYSATPPSALADNVAWSLPSGDRPFFLGIVSLGSPADLGTVLWSEQNALLKQVQVAADSDELFAYLITTAAWTPEAETEITVTLQTRAA